LSALQGAINVRDAAYAGTGNTSLVGGDLLSKELNLNSGGGTIDVNVNELTGTVTSTGEAVHVHAATDNLVIGKQCLVGDPTYYNDSGDITLNGDISVGEDLAIIASGNILSTAALTSIVANDGTNGKNITIVAGANVTGPSGEQTSTVSGSPPAGNTTGDVSFSGASASGGDINFTKASGLLQINASSATGNAGNVVLAAYHDAGQATNTGTILMPANGKIDATAPSGTPGNVTVLAGYGNFLGGGNSPFISGISGGNVIVATSQPDISFGGPITFNKNGAVTTGNGIVRNFNNGLEPVFMTLAGNINATGSVNASAGYLYAAGNITTVDRPIILTTSSFLDLGGTISTNGGGNIVMVSSGTIRSYPGSSVNTHATTGNSGNISMFAGVNYSEGSTAIIISSGGGSSTGGDINLANAPGHGAINELSAQFQGANGNGGTITLVASKDSLTGNNGGLVVLPSALTASTGGAGTGNNGNFFAIANSSTDAIGTVANPLSVNTTSGKTGTGDINLSVSQVQTVLITRFSGNLDPYTALGGVPSSGNINHGKLNTSAANLTITVGGPYTFDTTLPTTSNLIIKTDGLLTMPAAGYSTQNAVSLLSSNDGISLLGNLTAVGGIALVAAKNIVSGNPISLSTFQFPGSTGNMTIVSGATFTEALGVVTVTGASTYGGSIDFKSTPINVLETKSTDFGATSGNMTLVAFSGNTQGTINLPAGLKIDTSAFDTVGGKFLAVAGATSGIAIDMGSVDTTSTNPGATPATSGSITLQAATPDVNGSNVLQITKGGISTGSPFNANVLSYQPSDIHADTLTSRGGSVQVINDANVQINTIDASGRNTIGSGGSGGHGGTVIVRTGSDTDILKIGTNTGNNFINSLLANGVAGGISASGGFVDVSANGTQNLQIMTTNAITFVATSATSGFGGRLTLHAPNATLDLGPLTKLDSNPLGAASGGGTIDLLGKDITWNTKATTSFDLLANGNGFTGGTLNVEITGSNTYSIGPSGTAGAFSYSATGGLGNVKFSSVNGALAIDSAGINVATTGKFDGGNIVIVAKGITSPGKAISLNADGSTTSGGGSIQVTDLAVENITIGTANGNFNFSAQGGKGDVPNSVVGSGGVVIVSTLGNITADAAQIKVGFTDTAGSGGVINLQAGGTLLVNGNFDVDAGATGATGGQVFLISNSATPFSVGGTKLTNGITGTITAAGAKGQISVWNKGGGVLVNDSLASETIAISGAGALTFNVAQGGGLTQSFIATATKGGAIIATKAPIQADFATFTSDTGAITVSKLNAGAVDATTGNVKTGVVAVTNISTNDLHVEGAGGSKVTILTPGNLSVLGTINGGVITLTSTAKTAKTMLVDDNIIATGLITLTAPGTITVNSGATISGDTGVKITNKDVGANIVLNSNSLIKSLAGGAITVSSAAGSIVQDGASSFEGGKTVTVSATKGSVQLGGAASAKGSLEPLALTVTALNGITALGDLHVTNSIALKATSTVLNAANIIVNNAMIVSSSKGTLAITAGSGSKITDSGSPFGFTLEGGTVTVTGPAGVDLSFGQLVADTKALTVSATKGSVSVVELTSKLANVAVTSLNQIDLNGPISAATSVTAKTTNTKSSADIHLHHNISAGSAGTITLTAATGSEIDDTSAVINPTLQGGTIVLTGPQDINLSHGTNLISTTKSITLTAAKGDITMTFNGKVNAKTSLTLSALKSIASSAPVQAVTGITVTASDKTKGDVTISNSFKATGAGSKVTITANGNNGFTTNGGTLESDGAFTIKAPSGNIDILAGGVQSHSGAVTLTGVEYDSTGSTVNAGTTVAITGTGKDSSDSVIVGTTVTTNGGITIKGAGGSITTTKNSLIKAQATSTKTKTKILINDTNTVDGKITIDGTVWTVATDAARANGGITIAVGTAPVTGKNPISTGDISNITVSHSGSTPTGKVFGGVTALTGGIVGSGPGSASLSTVETANVILNTPSAANPITFTENAIVIADPPPATSAFSSVQMLHVASNAVPVAPQIPQAGRFNSPVVASGTVSPISISNMGVPQSSTLLGGVTVYQLANRTAFGGDGTGWTTGGSAVAYSRNGGTRQGMAWISDTEVVGGRIPASLHQVAGETKLDGGSLLVAPEADSVIKTSLGNISIKAKSLVLVLTFSGGIAVYNLHDTCKNAVQLESGGRTLAIQPGRSVVVVNNRDKRFEEINPAQLICYGPLSESNLASDMKMFHGEFSLPSAINAVPTLRNLLNSSDAKNKKLADQFLKTTSIMLQLRSNASQFRQIQKPQLTAYNR